MRALACFSLIVVVALASAAEAAPRETTHGTTAAQPRWEIDHYVYDASLKRDWEVLVDRNHPDAPARMELARRGVRKPGRAAQGGDAARARKTDGGAWTAPPANRTITNPQPPVVMKAGVAVEVSSPPNAPAHILLAGIAMQTAFLDQPVRVRLSLSGRFIRGIVRGPHSVELATGARPSWRKP